jgi:FMN phosphatase YigB (HAD superfamily)
MLNKPAVDWSAIDTVLLDMDGTLLDLRFDNWFWQELIPRRYAAANGLSEAETRGLLAPKFIEAFWPRLAAKQRFQPQRTLIVDDSLAVLKAASDFGIGWLRAVRRPDSGQPPQHTGDYAAVDRVADLM